jgi:NTE family protein
MSMPIYFEALRFDGRQFGQGDYYVDGGLYDNFPMHIFDQPVFAIRNRYYKDGINWRTLGLFLFPARLKNQAEPEFPENVWEFVNLAVRNIYNAHQVSNYQTNPVDRQRTIEIDDCGISAVEFDILPGSIKYNQLYQSGKAAVRAYFGVDDPQE